MDNYCIYLRKSRADFEAESHGEGETLSRHRTALTELANKHGYSIGHIYEEIVSGDTIAARPEMQRLLNDVGEGKWAGVLVMEVERLARGDTMDQGLVAQTFKFSDTKIITPLKTYDPNDEYDEEYFEFGLFMSRREYKTINRRLQRGRLAAVKEGKFLAQAPYGYKKVKLTHDKGYTLEPVEEQAEIVRLMFEWYVNGTDVNGEHKRLGLQAIARRLNESGIPPCRHDYWMQSTIRDIIENPVYAGLVRWGYRRTQKKMVNGQRVVSRPITLDENCYIGKGLHEGIVSEELFNKAQAILSSQNKTPLRYDQSIKNPLSGLVVCALCGRKMTIRKASSPNKPDYLVCHARSCPNVSTPLYLVESRVISLLRDWAVEYSLETVQEEKTDTEIKALKAAVAGAEAEIKTLNKQLENAYTLVEQGIYSPEIFVERSTAIGSNLSEKKTALAALKDKLVTAAERDKARREFAPKVQRLLDVYDSLLTPGDKNTMLKEIIEKAVYSKKKSGAYRGCSADNFELVAYPRLPTVDIE